MEGSHPEPKTQLDAPEVMGEHIAQELPELAPCLRGIVVATNTFVSFLHGSIETERGISVAMTQATNDFFDVLYDATTGRGRSALKSTRTLFEVLVTVLDLKGDPKMDARYYDFRWVAAQVEADLSLESKLLPKKDRSADLHRRKKLKRDSEKAFKTALAEYGPGFSARWSPTDLASRARRHGLDEEYSFYRFASAVLHGTAGGAAGLETRIEGRTVFRLGPALALCPMALLYALHFFDKIVAASGDRLGGPAARDVRAAIRNAQTLWPKYRRAVLRIDRKIWPAEPPPTLMAILGLSDGARKRQWYIHNLVTNVICEADPPAEIPEGMQGSLNEVIAYVAENANPDELITIAALGVKVSPTKGARWMPDAVILNRLDTGAWDS